MKISPIPAGGTPGVDIGAVSTQRTSPDKIAAAKAIARGESPPVQVSSEDPQVARAQATLKRIKMRTQVSPDRRVEEVVSSEAQNIPNDEIDTQAATQNAISETNEQAAQEPSEEKPLGPQFAALAKQRRALQQERAKFEAEKAQVQTNPQGNRTEFLGQIKSNPLRILEEAGVSYQELADAIQSNPVNPDVLELKTQVKNLTEALDKRFTDHDAQTKQQALAEMRKEATRLVAQGDAFELVRATNSVPKVIDLIDRTYSETGEVLDVPEALELIENQLIEDLLPTVKSTKLQQRLTPAQPQAQTPGNSGMKTLTNRDGARPVVSRRDRMIAAFNGTLKK